MSKIKQSPQLRWLLMLLCLLGTWTGAQAAYTVAGNSTTLFGASWSPSPTSTNTMNQASSGVYIWTSASTVSSNTQVQFKVTNGSWSSSWPSDNYNITVASGYPLHVMYKTSDNSVFAWFAWTIAGSTDCGLLSNGWSTTDTNNDMTTSDGINYTLTLSGKVLSQGTIEYKVAADHAWTTSYGNANGQNATLNIPSAGTYDVTFSFNVNTKAVSAVATKQVVAVDAPVFSVASGTSFDDLTGSVSLSCATSGATIHYNMTTNGSTPADPTSSSTVYSSAIALNSYATYHIKAVAIKNGTSSSVVSATYTVAQPTYTVAGNNTTLFGEEWNPAVTANDMTGPDANGVYTWQKTNVNLNAGTISFKVVKNRNWDIAYPAQNYEIQVPAAGLYDLTVTFNSSTHAVSATLTPVVAKTYTLYVYDPNGEPTVTVDGTVATLSTEQGTHVTWYKYAFSGSTLPSAVVIRDHRNEVSSSTITPVDGATDYYYYPKYGAKNWTQTDANYAGPTTLYIAGSFQGNWSLVPMDSQDGNVFTYSSVAFANNTVNDNRFLFSTSDWDHAFRPTTDGEVVIPGQTVQAGNVAKGTNAWCVPKGTYTITYTLSTHSFVLSGNVTPVPFYLVHWTDALSSSSPQVAFTTTDGLNYTSGDIALSNGEYFIFSNNVGNDWNSTTRFTCNSGDEVISTSVTGKQATEGGNNAYQIGAGGTWSFSYNIATNVWSATRTPSANETAFNIHVIDKQGGVPYVYVWDKYGNKLVGDFPGTQLSTTETINGETWYTTTVNAEDLINAIVSSDNNGSRQTSNISNWTDSDLYIVYDSSISTGNEDADRPNRIVSTSATAPTEQVQTHNTFTVYVLADAAPYLYAWNPEWNGTWPGAEMTTETLADGNTWYKATCETLNESITFVLNDGNSGDGHQTSDITQTEAVAYYVYDGGSGYIKTVEPTGQMYVIGTVNGNPWAANTGIAMTASADGSMFTLNNVQIISGATFAFATRLGSTEDDWTTLQQYRLTSKAEGDFWLVTNAMTDKDNPTALGLQPWTSADKNFKMNETAYYNITVDLSTMKVTISRASDALYMYYGSHWAPNAGVPMITTDGETYTLSNVTLADGATFQFTKTLGTDANTWPASDQRFGSNANGDWWTITADELNITLENALQQGSTKDFKMDDGTAGTYRVVVNPTAGTVALYSMATVLDGMTIIHLEKTDNVVSPVLWAYDKETLASTGERIHEDRPDRKVIFDTRVKLTPKVLPEVTTADGRTWWSWEVDNSIADFWFTREPYHYDGSNATSTDMTDIQWRKSGELYLTWPAGTSTVENYTRDYYAAAAQESAGCAAMIEGHRYVYFTNTPGWDNVFCHAWWTDEDGENHDLLTPPTSPDGQTGPRYPGGLCELVGYDKDGYEVWRFDLTAAGITTYPNGGILFNNGIDKPSNTKWDYFTGEEATFDKEQTGDFAYTTGTCYDYCGVIVLGRSLGNIIRNGIVNGPVYTIEEDLVAVFFDERAETQIDVDGTIHTMYGALYCKDLNNFVTTANVEKSLQKEGQEDYMHRYYFKNRKSHAVVPDRYDQSNWVRLTLSTQYPNFEDYQAYYMGNKDAQLAALRGYMGRVLKAETVNGQLVNNFNPEMRLAYHALPAVDQCPEVTFTPNVFLPTNLLGNQKVTDGEGNDIDFFFVTPKPLELSIITWAVYGGNDEFFVSTNTQYDYRDGSIFYLNPFNLSGYFKTEWDLMDRPNLEEGQLYEFYAITPLAEPAASGAGAPSRVTVEHKTDKPMSPYRVQPVRINDNEIVITAVNDVQAHTFKHPTAVQYVDVTGRVSQHPFPGVNIVVTHYDDGTTVTSKMINAQ